MTSNSLHGKVRKIINAWDKKNLRDLTKKLTFGRIPEDIALDFVNEIASRLSKNPSEKLINKIKQGIIQDYWFFDDNIGPGVSEEEHDIMAEYAKSFPEYKK